ncbi:MAG TPA: hypothetical protein VHA73_05720 [Acidimicrobiales bacterium]|jgi:hypothetical protein|nr:hypothetical protein [Acidimicrobiales bacterium]
MDHDSELLVHLVIEDRADFRGRLVRDDGWERSFHGKLSLLAALEDVADLGPGSDA